MEPSSRTPEGQPNFCPVCGHEIKVEPSQPTGDAPSPHCGRLLWFQNRPDVTAIEAIAANLETVDDDPKHLPGYDILDLVENDGLAVVYRARQRSLNRIVAIRTIRGEWGSEDSAQCLLREATFLARLQHPHVVSILDLFECAGRNYLVLEYIEGGTLAARIANQQQQSGPAATLVERLARTLASIHQRGIVHCNLKPRNVHLAAAPATATSGRGERLTCEDVYGIPLVSGFELALDRQRLAELKEGEIRGTPAYMAPEQAQGRLRDVGPATDIYGLGAILYEMLTARRPFQAARPLDVLTQVIEMEPESVRKLNPGVDRKLEAICERCMQKDPAKRYVNGLELATELRGFVDGLATGRWF
jgi:serine/threonine protein kinase